MTVFFKKRPPRPSKRRLWKNDLKCSLHIHPNDWVCVWVRMKKKNFNNILKIALFFICCLKSLSRDVTAVVRFFFRFPSKNTEILSSHGTDV